MKYEDKFKASEFLSDIGLGFAVQQLLRIKTTKEKSDNIVKMKSATIISPALAIQFHITNLINTYGDAVVFEVINNFETKYK